MFNKLLELLLAQPFFLINVKGLGIMVEDYNGEKQEATQIGFKDGEKDSTISCVGLFANGEFYPLTIDELPHSELMSVCRKLGLF